MIKHQKLFRRALASYIIVIGLLGSFVGGVFLGNHNGSAARAGEVIDKSAAPRYQTKDVSFNQFWDVWEKVRSTYVRRPVQETALFYGAVRGMVAALNDPYSVYFDPEESANFARELAGTFDGIGAEIGFRDSYMIVVAPLPDTPASRAGILAGDQIVTINNEDTTGMALDVAVSKIRGARGTTVALAIFREGWKEPKTLTITRAEIIVASVRAKRVNTDGKEMADGPLAVISINQFNEDTVRDFDAAVRDALLHDAKGLVLDLRNNPGGYLDAAVEVAGAWVGHEPVVIERTSDGTETPFVPKRKEVIGTLPTIVLVNKGSASASEIVAGALQDYGKATLVGETTFGKGSVQNYEELSDGSALKLTIAEWLTPKKRSIDKHGITPDVEVPFKEEDVIAGIDPQLVRALQILKEKLGL